MDFSFSFIDKFGETVFIDSNIDLEIALDKYIGRSAREEILSYINELEDDAERAFKEGLKDGRDESYDEGYDEGEQEGYDRGFDDGKEKGYESGYKIGKEEGFKEGAEYILNNK